MPIGSILISFIIACRWQTDGKYGCGFENTRIPENSFWRKLYPFKERPDNPLLYVKFIPFLICLVITLGMLIAVGICAICGIDVLRAFLTNLAVNIVCWVYTGINLIYLVVLELV